MVEINFLKENTPLQMDRMRQPVYMWWKSWKTLHKEDNRAWWQTQQKETTFWMTLSHAEGSPLFTQAARLYVWLTETFWIEARINWAIQVCL